MWWVEYTGGESEKLKTEAEKRQTKGKEKGQMLKKRKGSGH